MKRFLISKLTGWLVTGIAIFFIFVAGWVLQVTGKDHGKWQSLTMFLPAAVLLLGSLMLQRVGRSGIGVFVTGGLLVVFGIVILFVG